MNNNEFRVKLELITPEDTYLIVKWRNNEKVRKNFIFQEEFTEEMHLNWLNTKVANKEVVQFIIKIKENDKPIGSVYFRDIDSLLSSVILRKRKLIYYKQLIFRKY